MLCKRTFTVTDVKAIDVGPLDLRGRVLAVRVKKGSTLDITAINMYYPPRPSRTVDKKRWTDTIKAMNKWLVGVMDAARERTTPILMCDLNDQFTAEHTPNNANDITVGPCINKHHKSSGAATLLAKILKRFDMSVLTTHRHLPPTYKGTRGTGSWIDHAAIPTALISESKDYLKVFVRLVIPVQATIHCIDHRPVAFLVPISLPVHRKEKAEL